MSIDKPGLCFVGHMLGRNPGYITTQGQIAADLFLRDGYDVISVSSKLNRLDRLTEIIQTIVRRRKSIDVLIVEVYSGSSLILADAVSLVNKYLKIPIVGVLHGGNLPEFFTRFPRWTGRVLRRFDELVAPSTFLAKEMEQRGISTRVIPNIIDIEIYPHRIRRCIKPKILWMRAFHPIYNPEMALRAFAIIRREHPDATMVMAGVDKGLEGEMKQIARDRGLENAVRFPGFLDTRAKLEEFSRADIYLNTNDIDNMPVTVLEACATGLAVVATNVGGLSALIDDGENGLLVSAGNAGEMADAVIRFLGDATLTEQISRRGRLLAERSGWTSVRKEWEILFLEISSGYIKLPDQKPDGGLKFRPLDR
jgi:glycosyltransferase involved in cell wall biosynthesis